MTKKNTVLIVDDHESNRILLHKILSSEGYTLVSCSSGTEAIKRAIEEDIDLILLDIMMPKKDGFTVFEELKANEKSTKIPVLFITVLTNDQDLLKAFKMGAVDYITKPFTPTEVRIKIKTQIELLNSRKLIAEKIPRLEKSDSESKVFSISNLNENLVSIKKQIQNLKKTPLDRKEKDQLAESIVFSNEISKMLERLNK